MRNLSPGARATVSEYRSWKPTARAFRLRAVILTILLIGVFRAVAQDTDWGKAALAEQQTVMARQAFAAAYEFLSRFVDNAELPPFPTVIYDISADTEVPPTSLGTYDGSAQIRVPPLGLDPGRWSLWGHDLTSSLYYSILVHEMCHYLVNTITPGLTMAEQEYIAYVAQFESMPDELRQAILTSSPATGFDTFLQINVVSYAFLGEAFGIASYRYHMRHPSTIERILNGTIYDDLPVYHKPGFWNMGAQTGTGG